MKLQWRKAFITALKNTGSITAAAKSARIDRRTAYRLRESDPEFAREWDEGLEAAADALEDEARRRAFNGSDVLLMFLLKGLRPQKWRESRATIPPAELNKMIEAELQRLAKQKDAEASAPVN